MIWLVLSLSTAMLLFTSTGCSSHPEKNNQQSSMSTDSSETAGVKVPDKWDFYHCRVDDKAASIFLNFWFRDEGPIRSADNLYWCQIEMLEPGEHGMGVGNDAKALQGIEDAIAKNAEDAGFYYVGRLRNDGRWQLVFYGNQDLESTLHRIVANVIPDFSEREYVVDSKPDSGWTYYYEFICPDAERWQWIMDRRVIENLQSDGDPLTQPRRVDHWAYFESAASRDEFIDAVSNQGFELEHAADVSPGERPFSAQVFRVDSVQLEDIHDVVMTLVRVADELEGEYDGWETSVERP
jgi:Regulator of ribonuclease activity B/Family of unknown function (DUF695)